MISVMPGGSNARCTTADEAGGVVRLRVQVAFLEEHPEVDAVGGSVIVVDAANNSSRTVEHPSSPGDVLWSMIFGCAIAHPSSMV